MKCIVRALSITLLSLGALLLALKSACYCQAWRNQREAERALAAVRDLQPGVTTIAEAENLVSSRGFVFMQHCGPDLDHRAHFEVFNSSDWEVKPVVLSPDYLREIETRVLLPHGTMFLISIACDTHVVREVRILEAQDFKGNPHPYSAATKLLPPGVAADAESGEQNVNHAAYFVWSSGSLVYDGPRLVRTIPDYREFVFVTPEASPEERRRALDFHLNCFTRFRGCQDMNLILDASPNR